MFYKILMIVTGLKIMLIPAYFSTDFEVHRNWMAITHNLPLAKWYYEKSSEWTLDYPPFFAYFEWFLSQFAKLVDPKMLKIRNFNYDSEKTVLFQRSSVIVSDVVYAIGVKLCLNALNLKEGLKQNIGAGLLLANIGLIFVDHIHFQYNGFLFGFLLLSIGFLLKQKYLLSAFLFAALLNLKHIFLYIVPPFGVYFLKYYCWNSKQPFINFLKLLLVCGTCFAISFGPFIMHLPQILTRLFPFKRGLTHAYWAPNFWALYNFADKIIAMSKGLTSGSGKGTGGLVQEYEHEILPKISPLVTFVVTVVFMIPCLVKLMFFTSSKNCHRDFIRAVVLCSCTSFMFGWHVHEKAILMVVIPLSLLALVDLYDAKCGFFLWFIAHWSLHPLLFKTDLIMVKYSLILAFQFASYYALCKVYPSFKIKILQILYFLGFFLLLLYQEIFQYFVLDLSKKFPFLPLLLTSIYCSIGIFYFYIHYYYIFLCSKSSATPDAVIVNKNAKTVSIDKSKKPTKKLKKQ